MHPQKKKILDESIKLFAENGYDKTTMVAIIKSAGTSKGGVYHHFSSKEEIADTAINLFLKDTESKFKKIHKSNVSAQDKIEYLHKNFAVSLDQNKKALQSILSSPKNPKLLQKTQRRTTEIGVPILTDIFKQGRNEGVFNIQNPDVVARFIFGLKHTFPCLKEDVLNNPQELKRYQEAFVKIVEVLVQSGI